MGLAKTALLNLDVTTQAPALTPSLGMASVTATSHGGFVIVPHRRPLRAPATVQSLPSLPLQRLSGTLHTIFLDTQARVAQAAGEDGVATVVTAASHRGQALLAASRAYRKAISDGAAALELQLSTDGLSAAATDALQAEAEILKLTHAVWHAVEVATLCGDAATFALLEWLRENFMEPADESLLAETLMELRRAEAPSDPRVAASVWDVAAKLVIEGQPRDASKLLHILASLQRDAATAAFAELLASFPLFDAAAGTDGATAYDHAWRGWRQRATAVARSGVWVPNPAGGVREAGRSIASSLLCVLTGEVTRGLRELTLHGTLLPRWYGFESGAAAHHASPYARWSNVLLATILYGGAEPPVALRTHSFHALVRNAMEATREAPPVSFDDSDIPSALNATFIDVFNGAPPAGLTLLIQLRQLGSCAHLADLLWHAQILLPYAERWLTWEAAMRPHLLLQWADALLGDGVREHWRHAVTYAYAATRESVSTMMDVSEHVRRMRALDAGMAADDSTTATATSLRYIQLASGCADAPAMALVKTALLAGVSVGTAHGVPAEADVLRANALAVRLQLHEHSHELCCTYALACINSHKTMHLGTGLRWMLRCETAPQVVHHAGVRLLRACVAIVASCQPAANADEDVDMLPSVAGHADDTQTLLRVFSQHSASFDAACRCMGWDIEHAVSTCLREFPAQPSAARAESHASAALRRACEHSASLVAALQFRLLVGLACRADGRDVCWRADGGKASVDAPNGAHDAAVAAAVAFAGMGIDSASRQALNAFVVSIGVLRVQERVAPALTFSLQALQSCELHAATAAAFGKPIGVATGACATTAGAFVAQTLAAAAAAAAT